LSVRQALLFSSITLLGLLVGCGGDNPGPVRRSDGGPDLGRDLALEFGVDLGTDAGRCAPLAECGGACVDTTSDVNHCSGCDLACTPPANSVASCVASACEFSCLPGFGREGAGCVPAPRLLAPLSGATATVRRPTLRFELPAGVTTASLELCGARDCATPVATQAVSGGSAVPDADLAPGTVYWRVVAGTLVSRTWQLHVPPRTAAVDSSWGVTPDYDGDGSGDVVVGAPLAGGGDGRAYVFPGGSSGTPVAPTVSLHAPEGAVEHFGESIACAGDLNGDGYADLAVGAPELTTQTGVVHLYFGGPSGLRAVPDQTVTSPRPPDGRFGGVVAAAGDVDGDGYGDLLVAAVGSATTPGRVFLYRGGPSGVVTPAASQLAGGGRFGTAIAGAMDLDADGFADLAVGAYRTSTDAGEVYVFHGSATGFASTATLTLPSPTGAGSEFGFALASAGDLDGDGYTDLAVGAPNAASSDAPVGDAGLIRAPGRVLVWRGSAAGLGATATLNLIPGTGSGSRFGASLAATDLTGDGYSDLAVGAFGTNVREGRVYVYAGSDTPSTVPVISISGPAADSDFGRAIAAVGDADRSGLDDLVVGAPRTASSAGRAYVYRGNAAGLSLTPLADLVPPGGGSFGSALARGDR
jgi:hypothetical protein